MDREKVIKGLEILLNGCEYIHCDDCCFYISTKPVRCGLREKQIQEDALSLLKEQEPKQVVDIADSIEGMEVGRCPLCDRTIVNKKIDKTKFCKFCGQAVKWDE